MLQSVTVICYSDQVAYNNLCNGLFLARLQLLGVEGTALSGFRLYLVPTTDHQRLWSHFHFEAPAI